jgi:arginine repressor
MKTRRLTAIRQIVDREPVHSQEELRQRLQTMGFDVTQATLSRDIKELGLMKRRRRRLPGVRIEPECAVFAGRRRRGVVAFVR